MRITEAMIKEALCRPSDFGYGGDRPMFRTWSLGPVIEQRDSPILDQSNAAVMEKLLERAEEQGEIEADSWEITECNHWAVGWVRHLSCRVVDADGKPTRVFTKVCEFMEQLREYPVLDTEDYSQREHDAAIKCIEMNGKKLVRAGTPETWPSAVYSWLGESSDGQDCLTDHGADGVWVPEERIAEALKDLGWLEVEEE